MDDSSAKIWSENVARLSGWNVDGVMSSGCSVGVSCMRIATYRECSKSAFATMSSGPLQMGFPEPSECVT